MDQFLPVSDEVFEIDEKSEVIEGDHPVRVVGVDFGLSKAGDKMVTLTMAITRGEHAGKEAKMWLVLKSSIMFLFQRRMEALGIKVEESGGRIRGKFSKGDLLGRECVATFKMEEYNGRNSPKIDELKPHPLGAGYRA